MQYQCIDMNVSGYCVNLLDWLVCLYWGMEQIGGMGMCIMIWVMWCDRCVGCIVLFGGVLYDYVWYVNVLFEIVYLCVLCCCVVCDYCCMCWLGYVVVMGVWLVFGLIVYVDDRDNDLMNE